MNLGHLSDSILLTQTDDLVRKERGCLTEILYHLKEIDRRVLFSSLKYKSLFDYATRRLQYSEDQACRRIAAMKILRELPEIAKKIDSGDLTLTNLNMAQTLFRKEKTAGIKTWSRVEKLKIIEKIQNQSRRDVEKIILQNSSDPTVLLFDKIRAVSDTKIEIRFIAPESLQEKIEKLKGLLAHKFPELSNAELFDLLCEIGLQKYDPCRAAPRAARVNGVKPASALGSSI